MALVQSALKNKLLALFQSMKASPMSEEDYADKLAAIFDDHVKTADVVVEPGIAVTTSAGAGSTSAPGKGSLK